jgi:hypothetical protein
MRALRHLGLSFVACAAASAADAPITPEQHEFFESKIRPVLVAECTECHNATKHKGGLRLDYRDGWKKGGDTGDAIVPGDAAKSLLITSIRHEDPDLKMPAKAPKLDDKVIADFEKWVNMGAPDPRDQPPANQGGKPSWPDLLASRRDWWSLLPVQKPVIPAVKSSGWSEHPVDRFLLAKMEEHQLAPAAPADPRSLIRRLTFALTGLPPSPAEVEAFVADSNRDPQTAIRTATDRLLASPRFGEHWGRHWLDLMRYAETHGSEGDPEIREAWRYRDYVIRALNADLPLDQFIREQIAGDLLPKPRVSADGVDESVIGPAQFRLVEHGFQPVDTLDDQVKAVDNQIDVVTKAFQGLTVSCARCHDHKFDAISQRDYYALYGIFASCRPAQITIDAPEVQAKNRPELEKLHGRIKAALAEEWTRAAAEFGAQLKRASAPAVRPPEFNEKINHLKREIADLERPVRQSLEAKGGKASASKNLPSPMAAWSFEKDASDAFGKLNGVLEGGAEVRDGRLILDGKGAYLRTEPLPANLESKTLEAWVAPTTLDQHGGGVIGVESTDVHGFDTIVFAEREPRHWLAGSNNGVRSQNVGGPAEDAKPGELIHVAIVYHADNSIAIYRNGQPYGQSYTKSEARPFEAGKARVLIGLRHKGAGSGFFAGEVEEARVYDRALTADEIAASFQAGAVPVVTTEQIVAALSPEQREQRTALAAKIEALRAEADKADPARDAWKKALADAAKNAANPLHLWAKLGATKDAAFPAAWAKLTDPLRTAIDEARKNNAANYPTKWNLAGEDYAKWFPYGSGLEKQPLPVGEFSIEDQGERILDGLLPGGVATHRLSEKHNGLLTSPRFKIETDSISVRAFGSGGAMARVIVDNYPLPSNPIFPKANLDKDEPGWVRIDTAYRKGSMAYLEFGAYDDLTRPLRDKGLKAAEKKREQPSHFGVDRIVFHDSKEPPAEENPALAALLTGDAPKTSDELAASYERAIGAAITAWQNGQLTEPQRALLDSLARQSVLPVTLTELAPLRPLVAEYRRLEAEVPELRHAPGVLETVAYDSPLLTRGDHLKPEAPVPRSYLEVFGNQPYQTTQSGRLQLANAIASPQNPLTARVMANRVWYWLFGRGLVPTVDNFGRLGEKPTHPELLDFLAARLVENGWSLKDSIRFLVTSRAFQMSSEPSPAARESDPANDWLSHLRVRRLEAEAIRDSFLAVTGQLDEQMFGKPADLNGPRRSIYLPVRRTALNPFLQVFDAPKPFTTLGRRDATNVPAQSLTLLNSRFVIDESTKWSQKLVREGANDTAASRIGLMFAAAFSRPPDDEELISAAAYLDALAEDRKVTTEQLLKSAPVWQDFAQSLFNLKEFIYVR